MHPPYKNKTNVLLRFWQAFYKAKKLRISVTCVTCVTCVKPFYKPKKGTDANQQCWRMFHIQRKAPT